MAPIGCTSCCATERVGHDAACRAPDYLPKLKGLRVSRMSLNRESLRKVRLPDRCTTITSSSCTSGSSASPLRTFSTSKVRIFLVPLLLLRNSTFLFKNALCANAHIEQIFFERCLSLRGRWAQIPPRHCGGVSRGCCYANDLSDHGHGRDRRLGGRSFASHADHLCAHHGGHPGGHDAFPGNAERTRGCTNRLSQSRPARRRRCICGSSCSNVWRGPEVRANRSVGGSPVPARLLSADYRSLVAAESRRCRAGHRSRVGRC